jgi:hypothetical protein
MKSFTVAASALLLAIPASAQGLVGFEAEGSYRLPDIDTVYPFGTFTPGTFTVGAGVDTVVDVEGVTFIDVDFGAKSLFITFNTVLSAPTWNTAAFNGLLFSGPAIGRITSAAVLATTMGGFDTSRLVLADGKLGLNWSGLSYVDGTTIEIGFGVVPEPASWALMIMGFGLVGVALRRRAVALV